MNLQELHENGVITQNTFDWLEPCWKKDQEDEREIREEARSRNLFGGDREDESDDADDDGIATFSLNGIDFPYFCDHRSTGHANRVWHASIATCLYLEQLHSLGKTISPQTREKKRVLRYLEFGAGTAIPSLFLAHLLSNPIALCNEEKSAEAASSATRRHVPFLHVTDGKEYRNIRQILSTVCHQSETIRKSIDFRVSPHNWGQGVGAEGGSDRSFLDEGLRDGEGNAEVTTNVYDLIVVSDCIYNPTYHDALIDSIAATLKLPEKGESNNNSRAIVSFSLHGNTADESVWDFLNKVAERQRDQYGKSFRLVPRPVEDLMTPSGTQEVEDPTVRRMADGGWNMEAKMKELGLWAENLDPQRWIAYVYQIQWE